MGVEFFERAAEVKGTFLKAEQLVEAGSDQDPSWGPGYLLTFDVGRLLVVADRGKACLQVRQVQDLEEIASIRLASLEEEEPWWRLAGNTITRAWPSHPGAGAAAAADEVSELRMQFRDEGESPRVVSLCYDTGGIRVASHDPGKPAET